MKSPDFSPEGAPSPRPIPSDPKPVREPEPVQRDCPEGHVISGYWEAPTIRGLDKLQPRHTDVLFAKTSRARADSQSEDELTRLARLAEEARRCTTELGELLARLSGLKPAPGSVAASAATAPGESQPSAVEGPDRPRSNSLLPIAKAKANRVFMPRGVLITRPAELVVPHFKKGRLIFSCPACSYLAELYAEAAGEKTRCPSCFSAIRAPHPKRGIKARNMENQKEALLFPERFTVTVPAANASLLPRVRVPGSAIVIAKAASFLILAAVAVKLYLVGFDFDISQETAAESTVGGAAENAFDETVIAQTDLRRRAEDVVRKFVESDSWIEKMRLIRSGENLYSAVKTFYAEHPEQAASEYLSITANAPGFYTFSESNHMATEVAVQFKNYEIAVFTVEHLPEGDLIEWETSVGYNAIGFRELAANREAAQTTQTFRVLASRDDYYNYEFKESEYLCVRLQDPEDNSLLAYGYIDRDRKDAKEIGFLLSAASPDRPERLMVDVKFSDATLETRQVKITQLVQAGWRSDVALATAPANTLGSGAASKKRFTYEFVQ